MATTLVAISLLLNRDSRTILLPITDLFTKLASQTPWPKRVLVTGHPLRLVECVPRASTSLQRYQRLLHVLPTSTLLATQRPISTPATMCRHSPTNANYNRHPF